MKKPRPVVAQTLRDALGIVHPHAPKGWPPWAREVVARLNRAKVAGVTRPDPGNMDSIVSMEWAARFARGLSPAAAVKEARETK